MFLQSLDTLAHSSAIGAEQAHQGRAGRGGLLILLVTPRLIVLLILLVIIITFFTNLLNLLLLLTVLTALGNETSTMPWLEMENYLPLLCNHIIGVSCLVLAGSAPASGRVEAWPFLWCPLPASSPDHVYAWWEAVADVGRHRGIARLPAAMLLMRAGWARLHPVPGRGDLVLNQTTYLELLGRVHELSELLAWHRHLSVVHEVHQRDQVLEADRVRHDEHRVLRLILPQHGAEVGRARGQDQLERST